MCVLWLVFALTLLAGGCTPLVELVVPTATLVPTNTPLPVPTAAAPLLAVEDPWLLQEIALRPDDRGDLALLEGPTRYRIDLTLDPDGPRLLGEATITYTNNESLPLPELYLRLYPNMDDEQGGGTEIAQVTLDGRPVMRAAVAAGAPARSRQSAGGGSGLRGERPQRGWRQLRYVRLRSGCPCLGSLLSLRTRL